MNIYNAHTPTPWECHEGDDYIVVLRGDETTDQGIHVDNLPDAAFIVRACNTYDDLVLALAWAVRCWEVGAWKNEDGQTPDIKPILDALTKAKAE